MDADGIRKSLDTLKSYYSENPGRAVAPDKTATATMESGLRVKAIGPKGETLVTDMPIGIGGDNTAPTPGWYLRAALANCDATMIALRAAQVGIQLSALEVTVSSSSDNRGLISEGTDIPAGPLSFHLDIRIAAEGAAAEDLREIVRWAESHSPVGDALRRAVQVTATIVAGEHGSAP
jgi:uncharacterized OsmC-like protein